MISHIRKKLRPVKRALRYIFTKVLAGCSKIDNHKIVLINFNGKGYGGNPKYIAEELAKDDQYKLVWLVDKSEYKLPNYIKKVKIKTISSLYELETAKVIITNVKSELVIYKRKKQYLIQTWHGSYSPKFLENDAIDKLKKDYIIESKYNSKVTDLFISNSKLQSEEYKKAFWCKSKILEKGYPRNDIFFNSNSNYKEQLRKNLGIESNKKILLYAPTFRDNNEVDCYKFDYKKILKILGNNTILLVRMHPNVDDYEGIFDFSDNNIIDATKYSDIQELLFISDYLITDYSTTMFDFAIMNKPVFLYSPDIKEYEKMRGLKPIYYKLPFPLAKTSQQLVYIIKQFDKKIYINKLNEFNNKHPNFDDGNAAINVSKEIKKMISNNF